MSRRVIVLAALLAASCKVPSTAPKPPAKPTRDLVFSVCQVSLDADPCSMSTVGNLKIPGATVAIANGPTMTADTVGNVIFPALPQQVYHVCATAAGYDGACVDVDTTQPDQGGVNLPAAIPPPPTRAEMLAVHLTFQGLTVVTEEYGVLPWFEAALPWLNPDDRKAVYTAKHAAGDTHAIVSLPSGPPLYDEPNQPYSANRFGPLDWTAGGTQIDSRLADLVVELAQNGFSRELLFLGGDNNFPVGMKQLDLAHDALLNSAYGDLRPYVVVIPGWDSVFYGYTPDQVAQWGAKCRALFTYCGIEHSTGHIPVGNGPADYESAGVAVPGPMANYDLILGEFDFERIDDTIWQILGRMLGPTYRRGPEQPPSDDPNPFFYLAQGTPRGPYGYVCFESGEYNWVRGMTLDRINAFKAYLAARGCAYVN